MSKTIELPDGTPHTFTDEEIEKGEAMMARLQEVEASLVDDTGQMTYSEMLLPCPFCGGEARIIAKPYEPKFCVGCDDDTCLGFSGLGWLYDSDKEATEAWNRRAERTCRNASLDPLHFKCSECGADDYTSDSLTMWHEGGPVDIRYCPVCGDRIVEVSE